jgi:hypothetical protein
MPPEGFEPAVPTNKQSQTFALDRSIAGIEKEALV